MSLFGGLYVGTSGLQTSQNALNTVAHNMVNVDTEGFTRQQISQTDRVYNTLSKTGSAVSYQQVGLGVKYAEVKQVRDYFLDKSYRREAGRSGFYEVSCDAIEEAEEIFQELDGEAFANTIDNLWVAVQELSKDPSNTVNQGVLVQRCSEFITRARAVYENFSEYQDDLNLIVKQKVDAMNDLGDKIRDLNERILKIESGQVEHANDLRDERNKLIDELSTYGNISVNTDIDGNYIIQMEGVDFITVGDVKKIGLYTDTLTGFYTPYWVNLAVVDPVTKQVDPASLPSARVTDLTLEISTDINTDIGALKSALLARGDKRATFDDVLSNAAYDDVKNSICMNVMAEFDQLVHDVTSGINEILQQACYKYYGVDTAANPLAALQALTPAPTYLVDPATNAPYQMFVVSSNEKSLASGNWKDDYNTMNILINDTIKQAPSLLGFIRPDGIVDQECANNLKTLFAEETHTLNPEVKTTTNLATYYNNLISQVANTGYVMRGISTTQQVTVDNIEAARQQIVGVSSDEELSNMIMFQNAYNASSRYINVVSEMLEHIINTLAV